MGELYKLDFANGKSYIGITTKTAAERFNGHRRKSCGNSAKSNVPVYDAWRKHGEPQLTVLAILENGELASAEQRAIAAYGTLLPNGYNMTVGGEVSPMLLPDVAAKVSAKNKGKLRGPMSELHKKNLSEARKGIFPSEETLEKMRNSSKARARTPCSEETKRKISESHKTSSTAKEAREATANKRRAHVVINGVMMMK